MDLELKANQEKLFGLISDFTVTMVSSWIRCLREHFGSKIINGNAMVLLIIPIAESYLNIVAQLTQSREDEFINKKFDEMTSIKLTGPNHALDVLYIIAMLSIYLIRNMDLGNNNETITDHLIDLINTQNRLAYNLCGCTPDHKHELIAGEKVFTVTAEYYC